MSIQTPSAAQKVNLRRPDIMSAVQAEVLSHYRSELVERIRANGHILSAGDLTIKLAKEFGFCYGVERAIDLAYAARRAYPDRRIFLLGEIIHNPEVNDQIRRMGIVTIAGKPREVSALPPLFEARALAQPSARRPQPGVVANEASSEISRWVQLAALAGPALLYHESAMVFAPSNMVVLGDLALNGRRRPTVRRLLY